MPLEKFSIVGTNLLHVREKAVEKFDLSHDVMRHTFIVSRRNPSHADILLVAP